jgi:hypothetical protein
MRSDWLEGQGLVVQVSGGTLTRDKAASTRQSTPNLNQRDNRVDTISRAGLDALLFFSQIAIAIRDHVIGKSDRTQP